MTERDVAAGPDPAMDEATYESARPHLKAALEFTIGMGRTVRDWGEFCVEKFGSAVLPYLKRFLHEVRDQRVRVEGLGDAARGALFGAALTLEERDQWVRERAYFRAEERGFLGGTPEQDWFEAEREVDQWIAEQVGLVGRGRDAVLSVAELTHKGFDGIRETLGHWMEHRKPAREAQPG
jgi:hypothetical protein